MTQEDVFFQNSIGSISFEKVFIQRTNQIFNFKNIAYIELKKRKSFLGIVTFFIRIIFTNATAIDYTLKRKSVEDAKKFEIEFLYARASNTYFE
jgi:hypothetical protein